MEDFKLTILSDNPEESAGNIKFDFHAYKNTFVDIITASRNETPLVIGLEGRWGRGKTTLMKSIRSELKEYDRGEIKEGWRRCKSVWFEAWKYNDADNLLAALLETIVQEMGQGNFFERAEINIKRLWDKLNLKAVPEFFADYLPILKGIAKIIKEEDYKKNLPYFNLFSSFLKQLIRLWIHCEDSFQLSTDEKDFSPGEIDDKKGVLVVFIDDLDRCDTQNIIKVLEAVKLFLNFKGCIFIIGVSREIIVNALSSAPHVGREYGNEYLEKMIQVSYELPLIHEGDMKAYFKEKVAQFPYKDILIEYSDVIIQSLGDTPRKIKKFINNLNIQIKIADYKGLFEKEFVNKKGKTERIEIKDYIYWNVLKEAFNENYKDIKRNSDIVEMTKDEYERYKEDIADNRFDNVEKITFDPVKNILKNELLRNLIINLPDNAEIIKTLIYESLAVGLIKPVAADEKIFVKGRLPGLKIDAFTIGAVTKVEKGPFLYTDSKDKTDLDYDYEIDVFPVTNEEYCGFLNESTPDKATLKKWISLEGSFEKERCRIRKEGDSYTVEKGYEKHPVIYVSWYGADAYARSKDKELPTEKEWEKAARGPNGWIYPWGDEFDSTLCNTDESGIGGTTEVDRYPKGKSYYGCYDMAGNVWEWTDSWYDKGKKYRVLRGGSWDNYQDYARCACRYSLFQDYRNDDVGFRCARTPVK